MGAAGVPSVGLIDQGNNATVVQLVHGKLVQLPRGECSSEPDSDYCHCICPSETAACMLYSLREQSGIAVLSRQQTYSCLSLPLSGSVSSTQYYDCY
jgi:hypothetical protein